MGVDREVGETSVSALGPATTTTVGEATKTPLDAAATTPPGADAAPMTTTTSEAASPSTAPSRLADATKSGPAPITANDPPPTTALDQPPTPRRRRRAGTAGIPPAGPSTGTRLPSPTSHSRFVSPRHRLSPRRETSSPSRSSPKTPTPVCTASTTRRGIGATARPIRHRSPTVTALPCSDRGPHHEEREPSRGDVRPRVLRAWHLHRCLFVRVRERLQRARPLRKGIPHGRTLVA